MLFKRQEMLSTYRLCTLNEKEAQNTFSNIDRVHIFLKHTRDTSVLLIKTLLQKCTNKHPSILKLFGKHSEIFNNHLRMLQFLRKT